MEKKYKGPFEVRARLTGETPEIRLGTHNDASSAADHAHTEIDSGLYGQVTVVDAPTQDAVLHLAPTKEPGRDPLPEPTD